MYDASCLPLAVRAMQLNTYLIASLMPDCQMVSAFDGCRRAWDRRAMPLVDPIRWLENEQAAGITIPHRWTFTSDSIAAHLAAQIGSKKLSLLKSDGPRGNCDVVWASQHGLVDRDFVTAAAPVSAIDLVNLRKRPPQRYVLR